MKNKTLLSCLALFALVVTVRAQTPAVAPVAHLMDSAQEAVVKAYTAGLEIKLADVIVEGRHTTPDVGGTAGTQEMARAVARRVEELS